MPDTTPSLEARRLLLDKLLQDAEAMLEELGRVVGVQPPAEMARDAERCLPHLAAFCERTDLSAATPDGKTWMLNRIGLALARVLVTRHGGRLCIQEDAGRPFYLHFVVAGMARPAHAAATIDPFGIAHALLHDRPQPDLMRLLQEAEGALARTR